MPKKPIDLSKDDKLRPIDVDPIDLDQMKLRTVESPGTVSFASSAGSAPVAKTEQQVIKNRARSSMLEQLDIQMAQIMEQIGLLAKQVEKLKERKAVSELIYYSSINFEPIVGKTYFLYKKEDGEAWLSLIGPDEWKDEVKASQYMAKVRLLGDKTWDIVEGKTDLSTTLVHK